MTTGIVDECPDHGRQVVRKYGETRGPDPYEIVYFACGCEVVWLSATDYHLTSSRPAEERCETTGRART